MAAIAILKPLGERGSPQNGEDAAICVAADTDMSQVCNGHVDDDIALSEQDRLEISHLEESLDKLGRMTHKMMIIERRNGTPKRRSAQ
jgi:hypothetical protein